MRDIIPIAVYIIPLRSSGHVKNLERVDRSRTERLEACLTRRSADAILTSI
jgi:hypothetical protein